MASIYIKCNTGLQWIDAMGRWNALQQTRRFLMFAGGIERDHWHEMG